MCVCPKVLEVSRECPKVLEDTVGKMAEKVPELLIKVTALLREKGKKLVSN